MLLIGIDEAGYGPKLGPLCHGYAVLRCGERDAAHDLWALLHPAVMRHPATEGSITVDDSKRIYSAELGLGLLTEGVSAFLQNIPSACDGLATPDALYQRLLPEAERARLEEDPWGQAERFVPRICPRDARAYPCATDEGTDEFAPNSRREHIRGTSITSRS